MFKLVVLSAFVALAVAKPQVHQSAISYSSPLGGHSSSFAASGSPMGSAVSSSLSSSSLHGNFVANSAHAIGTPSAGYLVPEFRAYTPSAPSASSYSTAFASSQGYSTPAAYDSQDFQNGFHNGHGYQNGQEYHSGREYNSGRNFY